MAISVVTNVSSLNAQRNLARTQSSLQSSMQRLSSGLRINSGADDAAGLAISEKLKSKIRSSSQAQRNANDAVSLLQTAEGSMNELSSMLTRMRSGSPDHNASAVSWSKRSSSCFCSRVMTPKPALNGWHPDSSRPISDEY